MSDLAALRTESADRIRHGYPTPQDRTVLALLDELDSLRDAMAADVVGANQMRAENAKLNRTLGKTQEALENAEGRLDAIHGETPSEVEAKNAVLSAKLIDAIRKQSWIMRLADDMQAELIAERDTLKARVAELGEQWVKL